MRRLRVKPIKKINYIQLLALHFGMAFSVYLLPLLSTFFFVLTVAYFFLLIFVKKNRNNEALVAAAYMVGAELFFRMTGGIIFYESGKYLVIVFLLTGMFFTGTSKRSLVYWVYLFLLIPGILFSAINLNYETNFRTTIAFNLSGPVCLGVTAIYCHFRKISATRMQHVLLALLLPILTAACYLYLYTPSIRDALTGTASNFAASGGFGPNQVATVLGLGMLLLFMRLLVIKSTIVNGIDLALLAFISYRALVTFSRGGVLTAAICAVLFLVVYFYKSDVLTKAKLMPKVIGIIGIVLLTWIFTSVQTFGFIDKRYSNQDAAGRVKQDITTGRAELITSELHAFFEHPITGIGIGKMRERRTEETGIVSATHNELSRLLSEHGIAGFAALFILLLVPFFYWLRFQPSLYIIPFMAFWFLTINHSSMRLAAPGFIYGLALVYIFYEKNSVHRKPTTK